MNSSSKSLVDRIVADREVLNKKMLWEFDSYAMSTLSAFLYANDGRTVDIYRYEECKKYFKKNVSVFSELRGITAVIIITKMALQADYQTYLAGITEVYGKLRKIHKFTASPYMVLSAITIYENGGLAKADENIEKLEKVYKDMKADHFWLTNDADRPLIALLVSNDIDVNLISPEISACFEAIKKMSFSKDSVHSAAQIMALSGKETSEKAKKLDELMTEFKNAHVMGAKYEMLPIAAALGFIEEDSKVIANEIKEIYDYLKTQKGFKWYIGSSRRTMYSILAYTIANLDGDKAVMNSVINNTVTQIIIEELIVLILIMSSTSSSSSSSSGSN